MWEETPEARLDLGPVDGLDAAHAHVSRFLQSLSGRVSQELIDPLPIPVFIKARDGRYLGMNIAWESFFGMPRDTYLGKTIGDLYPGNPRSEERRVGKEG